MSNKWVVFLVLAMVFSSGCSKHSSGGSDDATSEVVSNGANGGDEGSEGNENQNDENGEATQDEQNQTYIITGKVIDG